MKINTNAMTLFLLQEFRNIGKEKTLGSFTIEDLEDLSNHIEEFIVKSDKIDEPPF